MTTFQVEFLLLQQEIHANARAKGFWENVNVAEKLLLIHQELSEATEALRRNNPPDDKLSSYSSFTVELADVVIRVMDLAGGMGIDLAGAIVDKHAYNLTRQYKHGKAF